jgi:hypothetical protein
MVTVMQQHLQNETPNTEVPTNASAVSDTSDLLHTEEGQENPSAETQTVDTLLAQFTRQQKRYHRMLQFTVSAAIGLCGISFLLFSDQILGSLTVLLLFACVGFVARFVLLKAFRRWSRATAELAASGDVRAIGPLVEALQVPQGISSQVAARNALTALLPRLKANDAPLLNDSHRRILRLFVSTGGGPPAGESPLFARRDYAPFAVAILEAYQQVGDSGDLPVVERLAQGKGAGARDKRIQNAAAACLPYLQQRVEQERAPHTLLRAAGSTDTPAESLLRPAQSVGDSDPQQLLRAGEPESRKQ